MELKLTNAVVFDGETEKICTLYISEGIFSAEKDMPFDMIDCEHNWVVPGFIDLQVYGGNGILFSDNPTVETLGKLVSSCLAGGTTSILPTIATNSFEVILKSIDAVKLYIRQNKGGVLGIHLEGPFLNPSKKGAHLEKYIIKPNPEIIKQLVDKSQGVIKIMTVAPECCDDEVLDYCTRNGILLSAGHSEATYEEGRRFLAKNKLVTHLFNAMSLLHHREPGLPGALFASEHAYASIVADGYHVHFDMVNLAKKILGERLFLITDAVAESNGVYPHLLKKDRYVLPDGTLSGSALTMIRAVQNCVEKAGISPGEAFRMASLYPARALDLNLGTLQFGMPADFLVVTKNFELKSVFKDGVRVNASY